MSIGAETPDSAPIGAVGGVIFAVEDLAAVTDWYTSALGRGPDETGPTFAAWRLSSGWIGFDSEPTLGAASREPTAVAYWSVPDIFQAFARFSVAGATPRGEITQLSGIKLAVLIDPFGNPIGLMEE